jgi:hypothetical protein
MTKGTTIVVVKEPIQTLVVPEPSGNLFGFGENQMADIYTYTPVTGVFPAMLMYRNVMNTAPLAPEINARIPAWPISIKVKQDCRDYIVNGKTEKILADGKTFVLDGSDQCQMTICTHYYLFPLKETA